MNLKLSRYLIILSKLSGVIQALGGMRLNQPQCRLLPSMLGQSRVSYLKRKKNNITVAKPNRGKPLWNPYIQNLRYYLHQNRCPPSWLLIGSRELRAWISAHMSMTRSCRSGYWSTAGPRLPPFPLNQAIRRTQTCA